MSDDLEKLEELRRKIREEGAKAVEEIFGPILPPELKVPHNVEYLSKTNHGVGTHRLSQNPHEEAAARLWNKENDRGHLLGWIFGDGNRRGAPTGRDAIVAATIIQWLGSPVGRAFLSRLNKEFDEINKRSK